MTTLNENIGRELSIDEEELGVLAIFPSGDDNKGDFVIRFPSAGIAERVAPEIGAVISSLQEDQIAEIALDDNPDHSLRLGVMRAGPVNTEEKFEELLSSGRTFLPLKPPSPSIRALAVTFALGIVTAIVGLGAIGLIYESRSHTKT
jgi:hypothetical protein